MNQERVIEILNKANLALSPDLTRQAYNFLHDHIGLTSENIEY